MHGVALAYEAGLGSAVRSTLHALDHGRVGLSEGDGVDCMRSVCSGSGLRTPFRRVLDGSVRSGVELKVNEFSMKAVRRIGRTVVRSQVGTERGAEAVEKVGAGHHVHQVVIVGGGIAGLAAAVALHRIGLKSLVLEQSSVLRASGASLSLWANAWYALDMLGVGEDLRKSNQTSNGVAFYNQKGKLLKTFQLSEAPGGPHEVRGLERRLLMQTLAAQLSPGSVRVNSRVVAVRRNSQDTLTEVELRDGSIIHAKVVIGCDGVNSVVGNYLGLPPPRFVGQIGIRGVAEYTDKHPFGDGIRQYLGEGRRAGLFPCSPTKVYWFIVFNKSPEGPRVTDLKEVKAEVLELFKDWPENMTELANKTPIENLSRSALKDRWNIPGVIPPVVRKGITLAGDALHPMTPNLGQGGGTALEDAVILARTLGVALSKPGGADDESIQKALEEYAAERNERTLPLTIKSYIFGILLQLEFKPVCYVRDNIAIPKLVSPRSFLSHTMYRCGELPITEGVSK